MLISVLKCEWQTVQDLTAHPSCFGGHSPPSAGCSGWFDSIFRQDHYSEGDTRMSSCGLYLVNQTSQVYIITQNDQMGM